MMESSSPLAAAVVAAPIRKLCSLYLASSRPVFCSASLTLVTKRCLVKNDPFENMKRGSSFAPLTTRYHSNAVTGQRFEDVLPMNRSTPFRNGSVLDCLIRTLMTPGCFGLSTARSCLPRWTAGSYSLSLGTVITPMRRKPKNAKQHAAHSMIVSGSLASGSHTDLIDRSIGVVIGSLTLSWPLLSLSHFFTPYTYSNRWRVGWNGSSLPSCMCKCRIEDR